MAPDYADLAAERIVGDWVKAISDTRTVKEMVAAGVREGYNLAMGVKQ